MTVQTIAAVKCAFCGTLHPADSASYLLLEGRITRRTALGSGRVQEEAQFLGTSDKPTVLCNMTSSCLTSFIRGDRS